MEHWKQWAQSRGMLWVLLGLSSFGTTQALWSAFCPAVAEVAGLTDPLRLHWPLIVARCAAGISFGAALYWAMRQQLIPACLNGILVPYLSWLRSECLAVPLTSLELTQQLSAPVLYALCCWLTAGGLASWHLFRRPVAPSPFRDLPASEQTRTSRMVDNGVALLAMAPGAVLVYGLGVVAWVNLLRPPHWSFFVVAGGIGTLRVAANYRAWTSQRPAWAIASLWSVVGCTAFLPLLWGYGGPCWIFGSMLFLGTALTVYFAALLVLRQHLRMELQFVTLVTDKSRGG